MKLCVDARMINHSGIGVYIRSLLPFLKEAFNVELLESKAEIYSIRELFLRVPECDVFWTPHFNGPIIPVKAKKRVMTIHDVYHFAHYDSWGWKEKAYVKWLIPQMVKRADTIITVSEFSRKEIEKYLGISAVVIHNGVEKNFPKKETLPYFLCVGNLKPNKNIRSVIKAFLQLEGYQLKIVGKGENQDRVEFLGAVDDKTLKDLYAQATALVFPSFYEGFGLPPLEAMAAGIPAIVSNVASLPEVCGDAALYVNPHSVEEIAAVMRKIPEVRKELIAKGKEQVAKFDWKKSAEKHIEVFLR